MDQFKSFQYNKWRVLFVMPDYNHLKVLRNVLLSLKINKYLPYLFSIKDTTGYMTFSHSEKQR